MKKKVKEVTDADMKVLERYVVPLHSRKSQLTEVNEARQQLAGFLWQQKSIPPSHAALCQLVNRVAYQAGHIWGQALKNNPSLPYVPRSGDGN